MAANFVRTNIPNLYRHKKYQTLYGGVKVAGRMIHESLDTKNQNVAVTKLTAWLISKRGTKRVKTGTLNSISEMYLGWVDGKVRAGDLDIETQEYKTSCLNAVRNLWPSFSNTAMDKLSNSDFVSFRSKFRASYSATRTNGSLTVLREMLTLARKDGLLTREQVGDLLEDITYTKVQYDFKRMTDELPDDDELVKIKEAVWRRTINNGTDGGYMLDFLLSSGSRIEAAQEVRLADVDRKAGTLYFRDAKYGSYTIPLFPELIECIDKILAAFPKLKPTDRLLPTKSIRTVLESASLEVRPSKEPLTHHDLRHIFATRALEAGKDPMTVAAWLGHRDNGRTVMLVYGHLRKAHSHKEAENFRVLPKPADETA